MKIIGLTGQTGAGKSTVCHELQKIGYFHIDADKVARELTEKNSPVIPLLCDAFGNDILLPDGSVNRKTLAAKAFSDSESTLRLNSITHPAITQKIRNIIKDNQSGNYKGFLIDAIALFESGENKLCDFTISVVAPTEIRLKRIIKRDNISEEEALLRINAQKDEKFYRESADFVIENYPPYNLNEEIRKIFNYE